MQQRDLMKAISKKENDLDKMQDALEKTEKKTKEKVKVSRLQNKLRGFDSTFKIYLCLVLPLVRNPVAMRYEELNIYRDRLKGGP